MPSHSPTTESTQPIFVLGCPRSGTTLLTTMLHSHPRIAVPPETRFAISTYLHRERFGDLSKRRNRHKLALWITRPQSHFNDLGIDRDTVVQRITDGPPTLGSAYATLWEEFAAKRGKPRWGEKRPPYYKWTGMIERLFPDVQFVGIVRDPRACVASLMAAWFWKGGFGTALAEWMMSDFYMHRFGRKAADDRYFEFKYEDLVRRPREKLQEICEFLHEDFAEEMLDHTAAAADIVPQRAKHHQLTRGAVDPSRIEAWRTTLTPEQIGLIELLCKRSMRRYGYEPSGLGVRPSRKLVMSVARGLWENQSRHVRAQLRDAVRRRRDKQPLAAVPRAPRQPSGDALTDRPTG